MADALRELLDTDVKVLDAPDSLPAAAAAFAGDDLVIGLRFHALVAAANGRHPVPRRGPRAEAGRPGAATRAGVGAAHATADVLRGALDHALDHDPVTPVAVETQVDGARRSLDLMRLLLDDAALGDPHTVAGLPLSNGSGSW